MRWRRVDESDVLVVCTGNVCRSPYIAARLRHDLPDLVVTSAGTGALVGEAPSAPVLSLLAGRGIDEPLPEARSLQRRMVDGTRLVVTAARSHRVVVARSGRGAADRAFTLQEIARYLDDAGRPAGLGVAGVVDLARAAAAVETTDHDDDLDDPYGLDAAAYRAMAETVEAALAVIVPALATD